MNAERKIGEFAYDRAGLAEKLAGARAWVADILPGEVARFEKERGAELQD